MCKKVSKHVGKRVQKEYEIKRKKSWKQWSKQDGEAYARENDKSEVSNWDTAGIECDAMDTNRQSAQKQ